MLSKQLVILNYMYSKYLIDVHYIETNLQSRGFSKNKIGSKEYLYSIDQDHFFHLEATKTCIERISIQETDRILDIGGGFGGPARYIADKTGATVCSIEIQKDRYDLAKDLTNNMGLGDKVTFINDDFVNCTVPGKYTKIIAFQSILHFIKKDEAIRKLSELLELNGVVYIEDYYRDRKLTKNEGEKLLETVSCPNLLAKDEYLEKLRSNDIEIEEIEELTDTWKYWAENRLNKLNEQKQEDIEFYGKERVENAIEFAKGVSELFNDGVIRGIRIVGRKK